MWFMWNSCSKQFTVTNILPYLDICINTVIIINMSNLFLFTLANKSRNLEIYHIFKNVLIEIIFVSHFVNFVQYTNYNNSSNS
jgi:hypothetical protein